MNKAKLKSYAPQARKDFIAAVEARAHLLGLSEMGGKLEIAPSEKKGDVAVIAGQAWPAKVHDQRQRLIKCMKKDGFTQTVEAVAYTWFNRFAALRYMEIHDYLDLGYRVLSSREGGLPEILTHASELVEVLPGLNATQIADLKLAGNKDGELYRLLLVAQCNALSSAMPFLFERIDDESELLLPDNLIRTDSLIRSLVENIPEADWAEIEIIGWLYQFYISDKKDQVIGKVVASEDIPAATQLFTPNWIVKYMVQNSLGAQWLATYSDSPLRAQMAYYIEPAEQPPEIKAQLAAITPNTLNPEELTLLDPACGSGHILVEAYELFKAIYLERGYRQRDVAKLILEKNLYGLDIDERAAQLTGFALMMKGRSDDRRLFERGVRLNVMALVDSAGLDLEILASSVKLIDYELTLSDLTELKRLFELATTFGSLIQVPQGLVEKLPMLKRLSVATSEDLFVSEALKRLGPQVQQAELLAAQYDAVVANPPYMSGKSMNANIKKYAEITHPNTKSDTYSMFVERFVSAVKTWGACAFVTPYTWMFLSTHRAFRELLFSGRSIRSLVKPSYTSFFESAIVPLVAFVVANRIENLRGRYTGLGYLGRGDEQPGRLLSAINGSDEYPLYEAAYESFLKIPGFPLAYWVSKEVVAAFEKEEPLGQKHPVKSGIMTGNDLLFLRLWHEVNKEKISFGVTSSDQMTGYWYPLSKGGDFRKWFGNIEHVINLSKDGYDIKNGGGNYRLREKKWYFRRYLTWSRISSSSVAFRLLTGGVLFADAAPGIFAESKCEQLIAILNSKLGNYFLAAINPTLNFQTSDIERIPSISLDTSDSTSRVIEFSVIDWNAYERSWEFQSHPLLTTVPNPGSTLESSYTAWITLNRTTIAETRRLEEENNRLFIDAYGLADELTPDVPIEEITLTVNPAYRYGGKLREEEQSTRFRQDSMAELVSYAIGCMMGRYSLDEPGLIYAHAGNLEFNASRYKKFPADADGIVPVTDELWFEDDAADRLREFLRATWGSENLDQNMAFLAANLGAKGNETPGETIRRYLANQFFKDHLQTYKKRPIYWHFSSGKQGAFQALVYLHRYQEGTLARMRAEYVVPLTGKMQSRIEMLEKDRDAASATAARTKIAKQIESLKKKHVELLAYDEKLRHYADMRIQIDLDDGVKVNYGKFGDLLAEVKAVTGGAGDE